jgi:hypothetical protein
LLKKAKLIYKEEIESNVLISNDYVKKMYKLGYLRDYKFSRFTYFNTSYITDEIKLYICNLFKGYMVKMKNIQIYNIIMAFINYNSLECYNIQFTAPEIRKYNRIPIQPTYYIKLTDQITLDQLDKNLCMFFY